MFRQGITPIVCTYIYIYIYMDEYNMYTCIGLVSRACFAHNNYKALLNVILCCILIALTY